MASRDRSGGRARAARRIAVKAAYGAAWGGGGAGLVGFGAVGLLATQAKLARRRIPSADGLPPNADGRYEGRHRGGTPIRMAMLGDSSAAGYGCEHAWQTPGAVIARGLAKAARRPVELTCVAVVGARSTDLDAQVAAVLDRAPDVAVVMIGANDVTHRVRPSTSVRALDQAIRRLREIDCEVVVGTCPDLGTLEPVAQPLRLIARRTSRRLAAAQTIVTVEAGGRSVSLGDLLGPEFAARPGELFGPDRFHPSPVGYRSAALALLPSVCAALDVWTEAVPAETRPDAARGEGVRPVAVAAAEAAETAGTEVAGAQVAGDDRGPRGRWALLRRRRRAEPVDDVERTHQAPAEATPAGRD
ncbi:MAG TPA: SGNH/GDSL hydrolase family protein [Actinomycetes bacterium]|nr:SGNH/GDSL hydrolase family protein [Actinomycetes bacterium]